MKKKFFYSVGIFVLSLSGVHAQYLSVDTTAPATTSHLISSMSKFTFSGGNLTVTPTVGMPTVYALSTVSKTYFTATNLKKEQFAASKSFSLYPNPASSVLNLQANAQGATIDSVEILSLTGAKVLEQKLKAGEGIAIGSLSQGIYLCKVNTGETSETIKFIKQ